LLHREGTKGAKIVDINRILRVLRSFVVHLGMAARLNAGHDLGGEAAVAQQRSVLV
jgi:hypothetical protein